MVNKKYMSVLLAAAIIAATPTQAFADRTESSAGAEAAWGVEDTYSLPVEAENPDNIGGGTSFGNADDEKVGESFADESRAELPPEGGEADGLRQPESLTQTEEDLFWDNELETVEIDTANVYARTFGNSATSLKNSKKYTRIPVTRFAGKDYSLVFDARYYLQHNPDVATLVHGDYELALRHFVLYGMSQRRQAIANFNVEAYYKNYPELREEFGRDWPSYYRHYQEVGRAKGYVGTGIVTSKTVAKAAQEAAARKEAERAAREAAAAQAAALAAAEAQAAAQFQTQQATAATLTADNVHATAFLQEVARVAEYARVRGMRYGNSASAIPCEDGRISCDRLVARALYNLGFRDQPIGGIAGFPICNYLESHGFRKGTSFSDIKAGSIVVVINNAGSFHCFVAASYDISTNTFVKYDEGSDARIRSAQPFVEPWAYSRLVAVYNFQ